MSQIEMFERQETWRTYWKQMPEFVVHHNDPYRSITVHFDSEQDMIEFSNLIGQTLTTKTSAIRIPKQIYEPRQNYSWIAVDSCKPRYPIYIISKGRWESRYTAKALEEMNQPYRMVIEPQEYDDYAAVMDPDKILVLPFSNLGQGSIPARNWVWEHSISEGHERHWILDDNIKGFYRLNRGRRLPVKTSAIFRACEDFTDRFENVKMSGLNYTFFAPNESLKPYYRNTRIYSCILLANDIDHRWRGKYNEDTDLSLRILKDKWCTILMQTLLCEKMGTQVLKGGNTDHVYKDTDNRREFAESLRDQHPDCVEVVWKHERWHHKVDYRQFKGNKLKFKPEFENLPDEPFEFGMKLIKLNGDD